MKPRFDISGNIGSGNACATDLAEFFAQNLGSVTICINSGGGSAAEGAAMMAEVERHGKVTTYIQGICASAATLPAVAGRTIIMHPAAMFMIHEPYAMAEGTADQHRSAADALEKMSGTYAAAYARHTGHPVKTIAAWMKQETWLTADEALELNFCDRIEALETGPQMVAAFDYSKFRGAPRHLLRLARENGWGTGSPNHQSTEKQNA
ncbi:head maturation protease, ClpP-related [Pararhodobacter zhoushanensis]|uniref:ATP-dependent Clp protease proteolytic subunit n=1 Tax=Pararhodobacter zhoushanensis TaxID=2479545 RepID=A0ABT3GW13_9RHOB|nr:head maturation protease, ClpP-related [Pararhodobacter zhoushanensis]MCW1931731.1 Clp protease ClpP [Pararhodobacter zhoushanensis]